MIYEEHQREWSIQGLLPLTRIMLMQHRIATLTNALEQSMKIESMEGYPGSLRVTRPPSYANLVQLQGKISALTEKIQQLTIPTLGQLQVWCTRCYTEGHMVNECPRMRGMGPPQNPMGPSPGPTGGVAQVSVNLPFHTPTPYHSFLGNQAVPSIEYCDIF
jgi:hypothetical protein